MALQRQMILKTILDPEGLERLERLALVKPQVVESVEMQLISMHQAGKGTISDAVVKRLLSEYTAASSHTKVQIQRKRTTLDDDEEDDDWEI